MVLILLDKYVRISKRKGARKMLIQESSEMYLETIYILSKKKSSVRSIDVAEYMGFSKPSVSRAVGILKEGGFITVDKNGFLSLTDEGEARAMKVYERHEVLTNMFVILGVNEETAFEDACRIEHRISDESFEAIKKHFSNK
jgi:Mn-dependent DtxR family transcriptional regulator